MSSRHGGDALPKGWEIMDLGSVCHVQRGLTYSGKDTVDISDQVVLRATNIDLGSAKLIFDDLKYLREDLEIKSTYSLKKDSLLICFSSGSKSHLGKIALIDDDYPNFYFGGFIGQINPSEKIDSKYLFYCLSSETYKDYISNLTDGVNINNLKATDLKAFQIPLPPLPEQRRIVSILDRAFAAIDRAKANAEKNLQNARELFESYLHNLFSDIFESNLKKSIKELAKVTGGYSFKSGDFKRSGKYQVLRMGNVRPGVIRKNEKPVFIDTVDEKVLLKALLFPNDVIITQTGTKNKRDYGFTVIIEETNYLLNQRIASIRFSEFYLPKFFLYFSWTNIFKDQYFANETGTVGQGNVGIGAITNSKIPFISLEKQKAVVAKVNRILTETQKLEALYQKKIDDLEELKKSILQKAFSGELETMELVDFKHL